MTDAPALIIAGVGLSFLGIELVTNALQESTSRTVRSLIRRSTRSLPSCVLVGTAAGALVQSASAVVTVLGSTTSAGMTSLRQAIPIVAFANVGTTALVFAASLDLSFAVLIAIGISGIAFSLSREFHWKAVASIVLGVALLLYGSDLMGSGASDVQGAGWFASFLRTWHGSAFIAFFLGCLTSFLTQSTTSTALMTTAIANAGLVDGQPALAMIYGANLGSTLMRLLLTRRTSGAPLQLSRVQDLLKTAGTAAFVLLFFVERQLEIPGMYALVSGLSPSLPVALATANLIFNASIAVAALILAGPIERLVIRRWVPDPGDDLGEPKYAVPAALADAATATDVLEREQMRMLKGTRDYMGMVRMCTSGVDRAAADGLHRRFGHLFREIEHFHAALVSKQIDDTTSARIGDVQGRQKVVELLENSLHQLAVTLEGRWRGGALEPLIENFIETLDFLLLTACDAAGTLEYDRAGFLSTLTGDRSEMMAGVRNMYLSSERSLSASERALLLRLTALFERIVWMLQRYADLLLRSIEVPADTPPAVDRVASV